MDPVIYMSDMHGKIIQLMAKSFLRVDFTDTNEDHQTLGHLATDK